MAKEPLRKVRDDAAQDLTKTYRPTKDWSVPLEQILEQLPPEALEPSGHIATADTKQQAIRT